MRCSTKLLKNKILYSVQYKINNSIQDNYLKYVISCDTFNFSQNGIIHKNIIDFLLNK